MSDLERVLYVDDDGDIREIAEIALSDLGGFVVAVAASGQEGLSLAREFRPQLIVLDVMMPGMDGPTTLEHLRAEADLSSVPVVFATAKIRSSETQRYEDLGAAGVIPKPFDPLTLAQQLREIWTGLAL